MNYTVGERVVYGGSGVCSIDDIRDISFYHERPKKYYVLKPMFVKQASTVYVPFDNEKLTAKIKPVILKVGQLLRLIPRMRLSNLSMP